jgi:hypothetical protein
MGRIILGYTRRLGKVKNRFKKIKSFGDAILDFARCDRKTRQGFSNRQSLRAAY